MDLKIKDVSELLNLSETTIRRWVAEGKIPAYRLNRQYRFSKMEIEDWVMNRRLGEIKEKELKDNVLEDETGSSSRVKPGTQQYSLYRAIHKGGVFPNTSGDTKEEIIRAGSKLIAHRFDWDADTLTELLLDRENMMPTALNNGIGVPHARDSFINKHFDAVSIIFPKKPIEYGALDQKPVHTLFFLFACEDKRHLHLLAKLAHLSSHPDALKFFATHPTQDKVLEYVKAWESSVN